MHTSKTILALSPYHGGSHKAWFDAWQRRSRHHFHLLSLPARKWKWRMRGAAMKFAKEASQLGSHPTFDALVATDMMNLAEFLALTRPWFDRCPAILYMHENQTSYPLQPGERIDYHYALTNLVSIMAATQTVFNSSFNRDNFFAEIKKILNKMPDAKIEPPRIHELQSKSLVLSPGIDDKITTKKKTANTIPTILWNHRWDHDKQPQVFANALLNLHRKGIPFHVILCGEQFRENPTSFEQAKDILGGRILHYGYAPTQKKYLELLHQSDIAVSTANQEFFGISVLEAIAAG
ncbi:DUF3524 domain-containing protein, partial [bacterium]|nr:DUF3524 domain-containing protein [bacterium]